MITEKSVVVASGNVASTDLDTETILLGYDSGQYHALNDIGTEIWTMIQAPMLVDDICRRLLLEYDVEPGVCRREVSALLSAMLSNGLIEIR